MRTKISAISVRLQRELDRLRFVAIVAVAAVATGCITPHQSAACDVDPFGWSTTAEVVFDNADTLSLRDAEFFLRCDERFDTDTLTLRVATVAPDSLRFVEYVSLHIPPVTTPAPLTAEAVVPYRRRIRLAQQGAYRFFITPCRSVRGVEAIGIHFAPSD